MLDIRIIRERPEEVARALMSRGVDADVPALVSLDERRRGILVKVEELRALKNRSSSAIAKAAPKERARLIAEMRVSDKDADRLEQELAGIEGEIDAQLRQWPNLPLPDVPVGPGEEGNVELRRVGEPTTFTFEPRDHVEIGKLLGVIDAERAARVAGARFVYLFGDLVRLQQALAAFVFDVLTDRKTLAKIIKARKLAVPDAPFVPVVPPLMISPETFDRMARLEPKEERYHIPSDDLYLIGSAEHTLGPIHMDEILPAPTLPRRYAAFTPAFRREAGSYGKDTRGILRLHQFDKIEMESFTAPEHSLAEQEFFVAIQEHVVAALGIPYRVMRICTGDMGGPDARQIDIECWMPGQGAYRETHTADLMTDYQARRLKTRIRREDGEIVHAHMNDGTAVAMGRMLIAIMENYQEGDGGVRIPEALRPYMGKAMRLSPPTR